MAKTSNYFQEGKNNITWVESNFREWFSDTSFVSKDGKVPLKFKKLEKFMTAAEILSEWNPEPITLGDVAWAMEKSADMLKSGYANLFYLKDKHDVLRAVGAHWSAGDGGWRVYADEVSGPVAWFDGIRVFSRKFLNPLKLVPDNRFLKPSDPSGLETAVEMCKEAGLVVYKPL